MYDLKANWDEGVGLWSAPGPGHTVETKNLETVHPAPNASARLMGAALAGRLDEVNVAAVLRALRAMQHTGEDPQLGCIRWYWQETRPIDTNASFFAAMGLIPFYKVWGDQLAPADRAMLEEILLGFQQWFLHEVDTQAAFYPNKFLGDLVCAWLILELFPDRQNARTEHVIDVMTQSAEYWQHNGWGWGEHLSDGYAVVCLHELSMLLLLSDRLPDSLRDHYTALMRELLAIEDAFGGQPRVPALRSYAHRSTPQVKSYRSLIEPWSDDQFKNMKNLPPLGALWHKLGWESLAGAPGPARQDIEIACYGSSRAIARVEDDVRLGTVSRFPVMAAAERREWGLSWQSFPVALLHRTGDWGFLQWATCESGLEHAHPANGGATAHIPKALTETMQPPLTGQTRCIQRGGDAVVLRMMPALLRSWDFVSDRFRMIAEYMPGYELLEQAGWSQLLLHYRERTISIAYLDWMALAGGTSARLPQWLANDGGFDWQVQYDQSSLAMQNRYVGLWAFSLNGPIDKAPIVTPLGTYDLPRNPEEQRRQLTWTWPKQTWSLTIDPLAPKELQEC